MDILHITQKGRHLDSAAKYFQQQTKIGTQISDKNSYTENKLFNMEVQYENGQAASWH
jgi:hypothetical protein